jgi:hypothetical protein
MEGRTSEASHPLAAYNYATFTRSEGAGKTNAFQDLLRAGDPAPDFVLPTPEGEQVRLADFQARSHVLLEFGSIT